jgi:exosortase/archaeosortase family protein
LKEVLIFIIKLAAIYLLWRIFAILMGAEAQPIEDRPWPWMAAKWEAFNDVLKMILAIGSEKLLNLMGYHTESVDNIVRIKGYGGVGIGNYCLAVELMVLFAALILSYPAPVIQKLWFIPLGLIFIQVVNMLRVAALNLMTVYMPEYTDFNHHFTFRILVFIFILLMYWWFIRKYGKEEAAA